jgi:hypothetical protein
MFRPMVRTYELDVEVAPDGTLRPAHEPALPPGRYHAVLTTEINGQPADEGQADGSWRDLPTVNGWPWPPGFTASRSQIYDEDF